MIVLEGSSEFGMIASDIVDTAERLAMGPI